MNFRDIKYLSLGTPRQREVYECVTRHQILELLSDYDPVVVSTICLDVDIESSDIDVVCYAPDLAAFKLRLEEAFKGFKDFALTERITPYGAVLGSFYAEPFEIEIFAAPVVVEKQNAYRHLAVLGRLIGLGGDEFREAIRTLKAEGLKTEPAIVQALRLGGEPFRAVLELENEDDAGLHSLIEAWRRSSK